MKIAIIDYGVGNLGSVRRALTELGADPFIANHPQDLEQASKLILPGVGSFADGMGLLELGGWSGEIRRQVQDKGKILLGICLGMHLLATRGEEGAGNGVTAGLDLVPGDIVRFDKLGCRLRIPHVGWNGITVTPGATLFNGIPDETDFYFVHSYAFQPADEADVLASCDYGVPFAAAVGRGRVLGTQFHPEKSSKAGFRVLKNFLGLPPC